MSTHGPVEDGREIPTFEEFAAQWFERQTVEGGRAGTGLAAKTLSARISPANPKSLGTADLPVNVAGRRISARGGG